MSRDQDTRYPIPKSRQCGDIDFVVADKDYIRTLNALDTIGNVDRSLIHEHHGMSFVDGVMLEPHFKVHNFQNPIVDEAMKEMFMEVFPNSLVIESLEDIDIPTFPPELELVIMVGHMVNHVYAEGLGLRQVLDFMMFMKKKFPCVDKEKCFGYLKRMRMERAFIIFTRICEKYLGMSKNIGGLDYTEKERKFADKLMEDIMKVGNFGHNQDFWGNVIPLRSIRSYLWVIKRCWTLSYLCPEEAKWWPISKARRFFYKKWIKKSKFQII